MPRIGTSPPAAGASFLLVLAFAALLAAGAGPCRGAVVAEYLFNGNALDTSGNGANGTLMNGASFSAGPHGQALALDGVNDFVHVNLGNYNFSQFTIEFWLKTPTFSSNVHYVSLFQNTQLVVGDYGVGSPINTWADGLGPVDAGLAIVQPGLSLNAWHHIAFTYDGTNQSLYFDGSLIGSALSTGAVSSNPTAFNQGMNIGARNDGVQQFASGFIDNVRIYDTALSAGQLGYFMDVPEPPVAVLLAVGSLILGIRHRVRKRVPGRARS